MDIRYRAFLSYSHKDEPFARWLHRVIEHWKVPKDLVGRRTPRGIIPRTLRPVFRDRDDFAGGASLRSATLEALRGAEFLVVLCSPHAARSAYVSEEVRLFKMLGRADWIIPVIIAGEPGAPDQECFPPSLRQTIDTDGQLTDERAEPIAADARESADGRQRAAAKVVAGLLGVAFDEVVRRAEQDRRRRIATLSGVGAGAFLFATALSSFALYRSYEAGVAIDRSLFALGGIIQRVDDLPADGEMGQTRAEILMSQCDILESLARDRTALNPRHEAICISERARVLLERGETSAALGFAGSLVDRLSSEYIRATAPSRDLLLGNLQALGNLYAFQRDDPAKAQVALVRLLDFITNATANWPEETRLRELDEFAVELRLAALQADEDRNELQTLLERTVALRARQSSSANDLQRRAATIEGAQHALRLAIHLLEAGNPGPALVHAEGALAAIAPLASEGVDPLSLALLSARLHGVKAAGQRELGLSTAARDTARGAAHELRQALTSSEPSNDQREAIDLVLRALASEAQAQP